jgi:two-component system sensor kinase FixL
LRRNGEVFPLEICVGEAGTNGQTIYTGFIRDLTEQQRTAARLEELRSELVHVARVGAMGTMASTLAHELNQPIAAVVSYVEGARNLVGEEDPLVSEALTRASAEAMRAGDIVRRLRNFVARGEVESRFESLSAVVNEALALVGASVREKGASITVALDPAFDTVLIDRVQIEQVLINLVKNAHEAGGAVEDIVVSVIQRPGETRIEVRDRGSGMSEAVLANALLPFYSTKRSGSGLGLALAREIAEAHGGRIVLANRDGGGLCVTLVLPR